LKIENAGRRITVELQGRPVRSPDGEIVLRFQRIRQGRRRENPAEDSAKVSGVPESPAEGSVKVSGVTESPAEGSVKVSGVPESPAEVSVKVSGVPESPAEGSVGLSGVPDRQAQGKLHRVFLFLKSAG
jgi:hypothetical protein